MLQESLLLRLSCLQHSNYMIYYLGLDDMLWPKIQERTKKFFVDNHESLMNQKYRKEQTARYLKCERLMHRWYQMELKEALEFEKKDLLLPGKGYRYKK